MYTYPFFQSSHLVYVKMPFHPPDQKRRWYTQSGHFYVGSTAISAVKCEFDRFAKLKQFRRNLAVHAELSICYWSRTDFESYTCIVLQACTTYNDAWVREHLLISSWQPALNHPFILKFLKLKSEGWMMQLRKNRYKVLLFRARGCIKEFDDACFLSDRCRHLIRFKNKLGEFCTKLACSQERALKHASEFYLENFIPWKFMLCTDWRLT